MKFGEKIFGTTQPSMYRCVRRCRRVQYRLDLLHKKKVVQRHDITKLFNEWCDQSPIYICTFLQLTGVPFQ